MGKCLSIVAVELGTFVLSKDPSQARKLIMSPRVSQGILYGTKHTSEFVENAFKFLNTDYNANYDLFLFPVWDTYESQPQTSGQTFGHWLTFVINLKDKKFQVIDSARPRGNAELSTTTKLMEDYFDYNAVKDNYLDYLGFRLHQSTILHIPCNITTTKEWFLVVVNFVQKNIQVLNPNPVSEFLRNAAYNVAKHFRKLFIRNYPNITAYDIYQFQVQYVCVIKCNFRYDSGIFILQFMQTFDGVTMENFSNADVVALRAKFLFQILTSPHNKANSRFMAQFYSENAQYFTG